MGGAGQKSMTLFSKTAAIVFISHNQLDVLRMGRKALPTKLKVVKGTARKHRMNESEPQPESKLPDCPVRTLGGRPRKGMQRANQYF